MSIRRSFNDFSVAVCKLDRVIGEQFQRCLLEEGIKNIPPSAVAIMLPLLQRDGQTLSELGRNSCMKAPTITVMANRLENLKLVRRQRNNDDRRLVHLYLTGIGREKAEAIELLWKKISKKLSGDITPEMLIQATSTLNKILKNVYDVSD